MATGKICRSAVFGRVIFPAEVKRSNNNYYLNFNLFVDGLCRDKENRSSRKSAKFGCSYIVKGDPAADPVVVILTNVLNSQTGDGSLAGKTYKSVEVLVEGNLSLVESSNFSYYTNLEYCNVTVTDNAILSLYKAEVSSCNQNQQDEREPELSTVAPVQQPRQVKAAPQPQRQRPQAVQPTRPIKQVNKGRPVVEQESFNSEEDTLPVEEESDLVNKSQVLSGRTTKVTSSADSIKALLENGEEDEEYVDGDNPF